MDACTLELGTTTRDTESALNSGQMGLGTKDAGFMIIQTVRVVLSERTAVCTKVTGTTINDKGRATSSAKMVPNTAAPGSATNNMVSELKHGPGEKATSVATKKAVSTAMVHFTGRTPANTAASSIKIIYKVKDDIRQLMVGPIGEAGIITKCMDRVCSGIQTGRRTVEVTIWIRKKV